MFVEPAARELGRLGLLFRWRKLVVELIYFCLGATCCWSSVAGALSDMRGMDVAPTQAAPSDDVPTCSYRSLRFAWAAGVVGCSRRPMSRTLRFRCAQDFNVCARLVGLGLSILFLPTRVVSPGEGEDSLLESGDVVGASRLPGLFAGVPPMRGGGAKSEAVLQGLSDLMAKLESMDFCGEEGDGDDAILHELQGLIRRRPKNILQELKSFVRRFSQDAAPKPQSQKPKSGDAGHVALDVRKVSMQAESHSQEWEDTGDWQKVSRGRRKVKAQPHVQAAPWHIRKEDWHAGEGFSFACATDSGDVATQLDESDGVAWLFHTTDCQEAVTVAEMIEGAIADEGRHCLTLLFEGLSQGLGAWAGQVSQVPVAAPLLPLPGTSAAPTLSIQFGLTRPSLSLISVPCLCCLIIAARSSACVPVGLLTSVVCSSLVQGFPRPR